MNDEREYATDEEIAVARKMYCGNPHDIDICGNPYDIDIDDGAKVSVSDEGVWVAAWVWVPNDEDDNDQRT